MNRFITYLYDYEGGTKGKGTGFIRVDTRGREVRMEVHIRNADQFQGKGKIYLITNNDKVAGINAGDITIIGGNGDEALRFSSLNMLDSGMDFSNVIGVAIRYNEGYLASNWQEKNCPELLRGTFEVLAFQRTDEPEPMEPVEAESIEPSVNQGEEIDTVAENIEMQERDEQPEPQEKLSETAKQVQLQERAEPVYQKIQLAQIRNLPPRNRYLCNNSFVLHGFFNYHYLILKKEKTNNGEKWSLGVPGVYEEPEKMMAMMFGFSEFEAQERDEKDQEPKEGTFGAWFMSLEK